MKCIRCGRELKHKKAVERGCGFTCMKKIMLGDMGKPKPVELKYKPLNEFMEN